MKLQATSSNLLVCGQSGIKRFSTMTRAHMMRRYRQGTSISLSGDGHALGRCVGLSTAYTGPSTLVFGSISSHSQLSSCHTGTHIIKSLTKIVAWLGWRLPQLRRLHSSSNTKKRTCLKYDQAFGTSIWLKALSRQVWPTE